MRFKTRLVIGHAALVLMTLVGGIAALVATRTTTDLVETVAVDTASDVLAIQQLQFQTEHLVAIGRAYLLAGEPELAERFEAGVGLVERALDELTAHPDFALEVARVKHAAHAYIVATRSAFRQRTASGDPRTVVPYFETTLAPARLELDNAINQLASHERAQFAQISVRAGELSERAQVFVVIFVGSAMLLGIVLAWVSIRTLGRHFARERDAHEVARRAVDAREELIAIVSHDLRTPLQTILMGTQLLDDEVSDAARSRVDAISRSAERMQHLIEMLLDLARLEHGVRALDRRRVPATELVETSVSVFRIQAERAGIALTAAVDPAIMAFADRESALQILSNLVGNAIRHTPANGEIEIGATREATCTRFTVWNTGPAIAPDVIPHLFDRYFRGSKGGSLGLGLYICKKLVEAHGGTIGIDLPELGGTTFWFTIADLDLPVR